MTKGLDMDSDDKTIGQIYTRREAIEAAGKAGLGLVIGSVLVNAGTAQEPKKPDVHLVASPALEEGPFFVDEKLNRSDLTADTTRASVVGGTPLALRIEVYELNGDKHSLLEGAHVDLWHSDAKGVYSDEPDQASGENTKGQTWLRGYQVTDSKGVANFKTIYPGWYPGRTPHIHFKLRKYDSAGKKTREFTSQFFFDEAVTDQVFANAPYNDRGKRNTRNNRDGIYMARQVDGTMAGAHLTIAVRENPNGPGFVGKYVIALKTG
jgi:protocatechuate 3,4-dioxygenase beta subunit